MMTPDSMARPRPPVRPLPSLSSLSPASIAFLNAKFTTKEDLHDHAPVLVSELRTQCQSLDQSLSDLDIRLQQFFANYSKHSGQIGSSFNGIKSKLSDLHASTLTPSSDEGSAGILGEELPALAKEVARVEAVRLYAETALKLDTLVGDIEDAVSLIVNKTLRRRPSKKNSEDLHADAIKTLKSTEDTLRSTVKTNPQWTRLISAVDHRVDRALAIFRPQAIADHRALLASLGWPPPLSSLNSSSLDTRPTSEVKNPLFTAKGDLERHYCRSFLALCCLQEFQQRRRSRQLEGQNRDIVLQHQPLWAIEELVNPVAINSQRHFSKWVDKPEFIFALVYKTTRDYVDSMDELLQPLVDEALLHGYSCREEWVSAMVSSLSTYLAKEIFPIYVSQLEDESSRSQARVSWLHLVDLMIAFDKRVQSLIAHSGILISVTEEGSHERISSLSVFSDRPDWLVMWAGMELNDATEKLNPEIADDRNWSIKAQHTGVSSGQEDNRSPSISGVILGVLTYLVDRCRCLPSISLRSRFATRTCVPIIDKFLDCSLLRCLEAEGLTALTDDDGLIKVANSVNAVRHFTCVFKEWCEDVFFLEIGLYQTGEMEARNSDFDKETIKLENFISEWVDKLATVVLRGFEASSRDYVKNRKQWQQEKGEEEVVSRSFITALDYLQGKLSILEENLNGKDFVKVWRSLASSVDQLVFHGILMSGARFHDFGVEKLENDMEMMFGMFRRWCLRPEGFFPKVSQGLKLLKMGKREIGSGLSGAGGGGKWLTEKRITHLTLPEAEKIAKSRVHGADS